MTSKTIIELIESINVDNVKITDRKPGNRKDKNEITFYVEPTDDTDISKLINAYDKIYNSIIDDKLMKSKVVHDTYLYETSVEKIFGNKVSILHSRYNNKDNILFVIPKVYINSIEIKPTSIELTNMLTYGKKISMICDIKKSTYGYKRHISLQIYLRQIIIHTYVKNTPNMDNRLSITELNDKYKKEIYDTKKEIWQKQKLTIVL